MARPTKYKEEYCEDMLDFFNREPFSPLMIDSNEGERVPALTKNGSPILVPCKLPTFEGFAIKLGVHRETLLNWAESNDEFFDALKRAKDMQKEILIQNGLVGAYEKTFAIFTAKNITDMRDKQEERPTDDLASAILELIQAQPD